LPSVFDIIKSKEFYLKIPGNVNGREYSDNVRLLKSAIFLITNKKLKIEDVRKAVTAFRVIETSDLLGMLPATVPQITKLLRSMNSFVPEKKIRLWLNHVKPKLLHPECVMLDEFLYLLCNSEDRI
jgi:hypothetical protein